MVPWAPTSPQPKRHLDRFSRFSTAQARDQQTRRETNSGQATAVTTDRILCDLTRHCTIVDCLQRTFEDPFIFHLVWGHGAFVTFMISLRRI